MTDLALRAESFVGRSVTLQETASLAVEFLGLAWGAFSPETIAASARASLAVGPPGLLLAAAPFDQAAEIAARLDRLWEAAQVDPAVAVVTLAPPLLQQVVPPGKKAGRPKRVAEPELLHQAAEPDHPGDAAEIPEPVVEDHPVELPEPPEQVAADHPGEPEPIIQAVAADQQLNAWGFIDEPEPEPAPLPPAPSDWFSASEAAELLGLSKSTILRWCKQGRLGEPGENWLPAGRTFKVNPEILDALLGVQEPAAPTCHQG